MLSLMLTGWHLKVARARELLDELHHDVAAFVESRPYELEAQDAREGITYEFRLVESAPQRLSVISGEIAHDLRSALDHLAWYLVEANGGRPSRDTAFPIQRMADEDSFGRQTRGMSNRVVEELRRVQPFASDAPERDLLGRLHDFNRFDKHRLLHVVAIAMEHVLLTIGGRSGTGQVRLPWDSRWGWPIFDGTIGGQAIAFDETTHELVVYVPAPDRMIRLRLPLKREQVVVGSVMRFSAPRPRREDDATVEVYPDIELDVVFAEEGTEVRVVELLGKFIEATQSVIEQIEAVGA